MFTSPARETVHGPLHLGVDIGTTHLTIAVLNEESRVVYCDKASFETNEGDGWQWQAPSQWIVKFRNLLNDVPTEIRSLIATIGVAGTSPSFVFMSNARELAVNRAYLWHSRNRLGPTDSLGNGVGLQLLAALQRNLPELLGRSTHIVTPAGFMIAQLTGQLSIDLATMAVKLNYDPASRTFRTKGFEALGITAALAKLPATVLETGQLAGRIRGDAAEQFGLPAGVKVVGAGYDSVATLPGCGLIHPSTTVLVSLGSSVAIYAIPKEQHFDRAGDWVFRSHLLGAHRVVNGGFEAGLQSIKMLRDTLRRPQSVAGSHLNERELEAQIEEAELAEPHSTWSFPGQNLPLRAPLAGWVMPAHRSIGSGDGTSPMAMLIADRRGVALFIKYALDSLADHGIEIGHLTLAGGGSLSPSFCKLIANVTGRQATALGDSVAAAGAAMLAATHDRRTERPRWAKRLVSGRPIYPEPDRVDFYARTYRLFRRHLEADLRAQNEIDALQTA